MSGKRSMTRKFITSFIIFIVIPFFVMSFIVNRLYEDILITHYNEKVRQIMEQLSADLEVELKRGSLNVAKVSNEEELMILINQWYKEIYSSKKLEISSKINDKLNYLFAYSGEINSIAFFSKNGEVYKYKDPYYKSEEDILNSVLYNESMANKDKVFSQNNIKSYEDANKNKSEFLFGISPLTNYFNKSISFIYVEMKTEVFESIYSRFIGDRVGKMLIIDNEDKIVISPDKELIGKNISQIDYLKDVKTKESDTYKFKSKEGIMYISKHTSQYSGWRIIDVIGYNELTKDTTNLMKSLLTIFLVLILFFILYSKFFFTDIIKPIKKLIKKMNEIQKGKLDENVNIYTNLDEIKELGDNYNKMISDIKELMQERDNKERQRSQEEIKVLQAQINPHFMFNTLNVIKLMAAISKTENIRSVTESFMKLLSATFRNTQNFITVKEELEYLECYAEIMRVRFGDCFKLVIDVDEEIKELYIIKLMLQPIVENAIIHGIDEIEGDKDIFISGKINEDKLILQVEDNGIGMDEETINKLLSSEESSKTSFNGIGVKNTEKRIKLNCGEKYGIKIESEKNKYTRVKIILPVKYEQEG
ncbi:histidine kinase [Clostridium estertheticum]|uniref:sensor histidine kinase n=1 Tax=Clostridium estertheticum TaxID=238834 RepID=UPI0013E959FE|nr:histidine kinase [Clostridium estertheticum]MBZ9686525.1 histidine kinase [Clostridium estertheticum]